MTEIGKYLIIIGVIIIITGIIIYFLGDKFNWFGNLPGDIKIIKENIKVYIPIASMLILSVLLSLIIYIINTFLKN